MATLFFPGCKVLAECPEASAKLRKYMENHYQASLQGCCRKDHEKLSAEDTAVVACNTCAAICQENTDAKEIVSVWELIDNDKTFQFPDYGGREMTVQDCWRCFDNRKIQDAVRSLLTKMNCVCYELAENYEKTRFCGLTLLDICNESTAKLAPKRFVENGTEMFQPHPAKTKKELMKQHCASISTDQVVCYCPGCIHGINEGGKQGIHLLSLLFT